MKVLWFFLLVWGCTHHVRVVTPKNQVDKKNHTSKAKGGMVATQGEATTKAALSILHKGGNAIDAFVAASFAISVERPHSTGLGGGGFLLYFDKSTNKVYAFDFREVAPLAASQNMFLGKDGSSQPLLSQEGALAVATPGLVRGLFEIHKKFGSLSWGELINPAIEIAENGFPVYDHLYEAMKDRRNLLIADEEAKRIFLHEDGSVYNVGEILIQKDLAKTLRLIAKLGAAGFYKGKVAKAIVHTTQMKRGLLSDKDLLTYQMKERDPVYADYHGFKIFSMPPPSSGGIHVIQILKMLESKKLMQFGPQSTMSTHFIAQAMQRAFLDRSLYLGDPDFSSIPVKGLLDERYLTKISEEISEENIKTAQDLKPVELPYESSDTTHFSLSDKNGNLVSSTQTINGWFGSGVVAKNTGIVLNNEMDDFAQKVGAQNLFGAVGGDKNLVSPKKRPLSSMSPTILLKKGEPFMALGSPSGTRIISCVAQTILNKIEFKMPLYESVAATRIHQQWQPDELKIEFPYLDSKVEKELILKGHKITHANLGCSIQAILKYKNEWFGVSDPRGVGLASGF